MITITITKADNSPWSTIYFDYRADADKWLAEEQTRPYWRNDFTVTITGTDRVDTPIERGI